MISKVKNRISVGQNGEEIARTHLAQIGYRILEQNYRIALGEIDIIAEHNDELVFVEVKSRSGLAFGSPAEAVTLRKQKQIIRVAQYYLAEKKCFDRPARFDVVSVLFDSEKKPVIEVIENAFELI